MMKNKLILLFILMTIISCKKESKTFNIPEIGWTMEMINGWEIESSRKLEKNIQGGIELIKASGINSHVTGKEINLVTFRKNAITKFQSTIVPFKESYQNEWNDKYPLIKKYIYDVFNIKIYKGSNQIMEQKMYRTYLNGYDFIINMTNDRKLYKRQMLRVLRKSKFKNEK